MTSHDVVNRVRKIFGVKRVGHAGTLDPNATGLLIVGVGADTKKLGEIALKTKKTYIAEIFLGEERDTDDSEGQIINKSGKKVNIDEVMKVLNKFKGEQMQTPPIYSAIKLKGKKSYELARMGKEVKLAPRKITVYSIKLVNFEFPILKVEFEVSSGTYIRSLARDIGRELKTYGYLKNLRRTKIGKFSLKDSLTLEEIEVNQPKLLKSLKS